MRNVRIQTIGSEENMPVSGQKNRGAREEILYILGSVEPLSKKPPLQNQ